jgi:hypothetical protein
MDMPVFYANANEAIEITPVSFFNLADVITDPASVTCVIVDPTGVPTTYTYAAGSGINQIVKVSTGDYSLSVDGLSTPGLYMFTWIGTGSGVQQVTPGTFRLVPITDVTTGMQNWYCGLDEFKSRNSIPLTNVADDYEISMAIQTASGWINRYCGTHFYQVAEARTYPVTDIYYLPIDQIVPGSITSFKIDYDGDGVFETAWTEGQNYQVYREGDTYNQNYAGIKRPFDFVKVIMGGPALTAGGGFFPFVWPFTHDDRVQITGTWGWQQIPPEVTQACLIMATQLFKEKDSPWGMAGVGDLGVIRTSQSPFLVELLRPFINPRKKVGV